VRIRYRSAVLLVVAGALLLAGCLPWEQGRYDPAQTGFSPLAGITRANAGTLLEAFSAPGVGSVPIVHAAHLYAVSGSAIEVFAADGSGCTGRPPPTCAPLWQYNSAGGAPVISGDTLYATAGGVGAFDANGATNCSGTPKTCAPLRTYVADTFGGDAGLVDGMTVSNGTLYVSAFRCPANSFQCRQSNPYAGVVAFDATGQANCSGAPVVCHPLWSAFTRDVENYPDKAPTVADNRAYLVAAGKASIFDATGTTNCGGAPRVCAPIGTIDATVPGGVQVVASNNTIFVPAHDASAPITDPWYLRAYDPTGTTLLWSSSATVNDVTPALHAGTVYTTRSVGGALGLRLLVAFDAGGTTACAGTPVACTPLFSADLDQTAGMDWHDVIGGGDVVYVHTALHIYAFDARGQTNCAGAPKTCTPLYTRAGDYPWQPSVAGNFLYVPERLDVDHDRIVALGPN
jgi:hypothetical protein